MVRVPAAAAVRRSLADVAVPLEVIPAQWQPGTSMRNNPSRTRKDVCYTCARRRRKQLFDFAGATGCNKLALGHHRDDIIETFMLNMVYGGNISTMVPRQDLFAGRLSLIRPLSFLNKDEIRSIADRFGIKPVRSVCPLSEQTGRLAIRRMLNYLYRKIPGAGNNIFTALSNVRTDYLPKPAETGQEVRGKGDAD
jgi:tRNA 2-thiocytidine biosynthesis protein TtcA